MMTFNISYNFVVNSKAKSAEVNQNFTDVLGILAAHHHDPNIYSGASPITNSGIAANAKILDTQLNSPITRSGLINPASLIPVDVPHGGTGLAGIATGDLLYAISTNLFARLPIGSSSQSLQSDGTKPYWATTTQNAISLNLTSGEAINASTTPQAVYIKASDGKVYLLDADADESTFRYKGFVGNSQNVGANASVTVIVSGLVTGFTGLTQNGRYYANSTAGTISTTANGTRPVFIGEAVTTTTILIEQIIYPLRGSSSVAIGGSTSSITNTVTLGYKPRLIVGFVDGSNGAGTTTGSNSVFCCDSAATQTSLVTRGDLSTFGLSTTQIGVQWNGGAARAITIGNITETGFDITFTRSSENNIGGTVYYIALP